MNVRGKVLPPNLNKSFLISSKWVTHEELMLLFLLSLEVNARTSGSGAFLSLVREHSWLTDMLLMENNCMLSPCSDQMLGDFLSLRGCLLAILSEGWFLQGGFSGILVRR